MILCFRLITKRSAKNCYCYSFFPRKKCITESTIAKDCLTFCTGTCLLNTDQRLVTSQSELYPTTRFLSKQIFISSFLCCMSRISIYFLLCFFFQVGEYHRKGVCNSLILISIVTFSYSYTQMNQRNKRLGPPIHR